LKENKKAKNIIFR